MLKVAHRPKCRAPLVGQAGPLCLPLLMQCLVSVLMPSNGCCAVAAGALCCGQSGSSAGHHLGVEDSMGHTIARLLLLTQHLAPQSALPLEFLPRPHSLCFCLCADCVGHQHEQHSQKPALLHSGACSLQRPLRRRWPLPDMSGDCRAPVLSQAPAPVALVRQLLWLCRGSTWVQLTAWATPP